MKFKRVIKLISILKSLFYSRALLMHGVAAATEHELVLTNFFCNTVIDIGANRGQFALVSRKCFPNAKLIAFEPLPIPSKTFKYLFHKDSNVKLYQHAIARKKQIMHINISLKDDSSSLLPISKLQTKIFPGTEKIHSLEIKAAPLNSFVKLVDINKPSLLKLDVQGYEFEALQGCESLLSEFNYVYCECSFIELYLGQKLASDIIVYMADKGFKLSGIFNMTYSDDLKIAVQADFLFINLKYSHFEVKS
jgi:FkbM family methyltransferase